MVAAIFSSHPNLKSSHAKQLHFTVQNVNWTCPRLLPRDWKTDICAITSPELGHNSRFINNPEKKIWRWIIKSFITRAAVSGWRARGGGCYQCCIILSPHPETQFSVETAHLVFSCLQHQLWYVYKSIINHHVDPSSFTPDMQKLAGCIWVCKKSACNLTYTIFFITYMSIWNPRKLTM